MKNRLILVEGIPGSGKTTIADKIRSYLEGKEIKAILYREGDAHPADMAWNAYFSMDEYKELLKNNPQYSDAIKKNTQLEDDYAIIAYTKLGFTSQQNELMKYFEEHEVYNARVDLDTFKKLHFKRWQNFSKNTDNNSIVIFECSYLQNHINELLGYHEKDVKFIIDYMINLIKTVENLNPKLIYLTQPNVYETIDRVAKQRVSPDKSKWEDWIDLVIKYIENSPYGKSHGLKGYEGTIEFFDARKKIELDVIDKLSIDKAIIHNEEYNWDEVFNKVISELEV